MVYDFRKPQYALQVHELGDFARSSFSSRDAECGISSLSIDPHHPDRLYFHLSWSSISGTAYLDSLFFHEQLINLHLWSRLGRLG